MFSVFIGAAEGGPCKDYGECDDFKYSLNLSKTKKTIKLVNRPIIKGLIDTINWYLSNKKYFDKIPTKSFNKRLGLLK